MNLGLRARVSLALALLVLVSASVVSVSTYSFARWYLLDQREASATTRAALDSRAASAYLDAGATPTEALGQIPSVGISQPMIRMGGSWFTTSVTVPPDALPASLIETAQSTAARQRFSIAGDPYFAVAIPVGTALYVEVFPLRDLDRALTWGSWLLIVLSLAAGVLGAVFGGAAAARILKPVMRLDAGARRIAGGELSTRIELSGDRDLDPIASSFNDMAAAVEERVARERRFSANVSHELRSPLTSVMGTAELLEDAKVRLPEREATLISVLAQQVRRLSHTLLDLLEISRIDTHDSLQLESIDIAVMCRDALDTRGIDSSLVIGDEPLMRIDTRRFERIFGNLIDNAQQHAGGVAQVLIEQEPDAVRVIVDDSGPGVDEAFRSMMFEPFTRGAPSGASDGAGLGLAIVREQVDFVGGEVVCEVSPFGGARFTVRFPP